MPVSLNSQSTFSSYSQFPEYQSSNLAKKPSATRTLDIQLIDLELRRENEAELAKLKRRRRQREIQRRKRIVKQRLAAGGLAFTMGLTGLVTFLSGGNADNKTKTNYIDNPSQIISEQIPIEEHEYYEQESPEETLSTEATAQQILLENDFVNEQYERLTDSLERFSKELGEDALPLIKERVEALGNGRVDVMDVLKILWMESRGRIYDPNDPNKIIVSYTGEAFGPFQLTPDTGDFVNRYYGLAGTDKELDIMDPYDNLDACILNVRFLHAKRGQDIESGVSLPTGDNLKNAIIWSYHDGAWANELTSNAENYLANYEDLSAIDNYPQIAEYILA